MRRKGEQEKGEEDNCRHCVVIEDIVARKGAQVHDAADRGGEGGARAQRRQKKGIREVQSSEKAPAAGMSVVTYT